MHVDLYSERKKLAENAGQQDVYQYDKIPNKVRVQIAQIAEDALGPAAGPPSRFDTDLNRLPAFDMWIAIRDALCRGHGLHQLAREADPKLEVLAFLEGTSDTDQCLDAIELICRSIENWAGELGPGHYGVTFISQDAGPAIDEINMRLRRAGLGYQYESKTLIRVGSQFVHSKVTKPALSLLSSPKLITANSEFLTAHEHFRTGNNEDAIVNALKAFESTLRVICDEKGWTVPSKATAKALVDVVMENNLLDKAVCGQMKAIRATLEQGIPTIRNGLGGHGQGTTPRDVPDYVVSYALHITASAILLLVKAAGI